MRAQPTLARRRPTISPSCCRPDLSPSTDFRISGGNLASDLPRGLRGSTPCEHVVARRGHGGFGVPRSGSPDQKSCRRRRSLPEAKKCIAVHPAASLAWGCLWVCGADSWRQEERADCHVCHAGSRPLTRTTRIPTIMTRSAARYASKKSQKIVGGTAAPNLPATRGRTVVSPPFHQSLPLLRLEDRCPLDGKWPRRLRRPSTAMWIGAAKLWSL